jgi:hypothetical protein
MDCTCVYTTVHWCTTWHYLNIHLWCTHYARISYTAVHLYCSHFSVHSGTVLLCKQLHCTTVHSLVPAWPLFCQPITAELWFTCFALIGPLDVPCRSWSLITACWPSPFPRETDVVKTLVHAIVHPCLRPACLRHTLSSI